MSDLEPVHLIIDELRQVGGRNGGALPPITPSINDVGGDGRSAGGPNRAYQNAAHFWEAVFEHALGEPAGGTATFLKPGTKGTYIQIPEIKRSGDLPQPLERVVVEGLIVFGDRRKRDQGNYRSILEKFLGDALQRHWLIFGDDWTRYEFGNLTRGYCKDAPRLELTFFPAAAALELEDTAIREGAMF